MTLTAAMRRRSLIYRIPEARLPPAPPLDIAERIREIALFDTFSPEVRKIIAETPIDIDVQMMLPEFRRQFARDRMERAFQSPDGLLPDATKDEEQRALADFLRQTIKRKVEAANRAKDLPADYVPLARRVKQPRQEVADGSNEDREG